MVIYFTKGRTLLKGIIICVKGCIHYLDLLLVKNKVKDLKVFSFM